jgi:UDP-glucuronate 4-epimerase
MRILVTGCAGFIGSKVSEILARDGHEVIGVDNINDAYDPRLKRWRLNQLRAVEGLTFHELDITHAAALHEAVRRHPVQAVINLAARAGVRASLDNPGVYYETNVAGTLNLLELCRAQRIPKLVLASTSSLYGNGERPFREDQPTDCPLSPYAASKKAAEVLAWTYHHLFALDVSVLRYFTVYGPAGRPDMSIFRFTRWIAEDTPIALFGDGSQERDFTYIDDIARGTVEALRPLGYEVINLGSDRPVPVSHVIALLEEQLGRAARIDRRPAHPADAMATWADIGKARRLLGWSPETPLADGLRAAVGWYRQNRDWASRINLGS